MSLSLEDFRPLELGDRQLFLDMYKSHPPQHSDFAFGNLFGWLHFTNYRLARLPEHIILLGRIQDSLQFAYPLGPNNAGVVEEVLALAEEIGAQPKLELIDNEAKAFIDENFPKLPLESCRDCADYVYTSRNLAELPGKDFLKHRNLINKFKRSHDYQVEEITEENFQEITRFLKRWCLWRDCEGNATLEAERDALMTVMNNFGALDLKGIILRVEGNIQAISIFEELRPDTAVVHYEKADVDFEGIYKVINQETAHRLKDHYGFINREHDLGVPGLRKAKERYRPHHMVEVYRTVVQL